MRRTLLASALALLATPALAPGQFISPPITNPANGHQYRLTEQKAWPQAQMHAVRAGGNLVTINDAAEQDFVFSTFGNYNGQSRLLWAGLNDANVEGQYQWVSGQRSTYTNWAPGEPNNAGGREDWVGLYNPGHGAAGRWNDWGTRNMDVAGKPFNGVVEFDPSSPPGPVLTETDPTWRVIAPAGNLQGQPINVVGTAW